MPSIVEVHIQARWRLTGQRFEWLQNSCLHVWELLSDGHPWNGMTLALVLSAKLPGRCMPSLNHCHNREAAVGLTRAMWCGPVICASGLSHSYRPHPK